MITNIGYLYKTLAERSKMAARLSIAIWANDLKTYESPFYASHSFAAF
jgi:hypothetical protein